MADSSNSTSAPSANPDPFDPANWLALFRTGDGWWVIGADDSLSLGWHLHGQVNDTAREIFREIEQDPAKRAAVRELILTGQGPAQGLEAEDAVHPQVGAILDPWERGQLTTSEAWDAAMTRYIAADAEYHAFKRDHYQVHLDRWKADHSYVTPEHLNDALETLGNAAGETEKTLMDMPAPDRAALRWKLDKVLEVEPGSFTEGWAEHCVSQTIADYRRLLGDA